jgi:hypothetical protein
MATPEAIAALRLLIAEPTEEDYDDATLDAALDAVSGNADSAAASIWTQKAASYAMMVDVSESGSSRKLGDLHKNALSLAAAFGSSAETVVNPPQVGTRIRRLTRS